MTKLTSEALQIALACIDGEMHRLDEFHWQVVRMIHPIPAQYDQTRSEAQERLNSAKKNLSEVFEAQHQ